MRSLLVPLSIALCLAAVGCSRQHATEALRSGDEIVVCGRLFHTGAPVVLWTDPGGYDAYRTEKRFVPWDRAPWQPPPQGAKTDGPSSPNRYGVRFAPGSDDGPLSKADFERVRGGGWDLPTLQKCIDQFVLHYDVSGVSRQCFHVLHDGRGLSIHFMLDIDGTVYQTMDVKEKAWHATISNDRSIGVEIANVGAYGADEKDPFAQWYRPAPQDPSQVVISIPQQLGDGGVRTTRFVGRPDRPGPVSGQIQGRLLRQYDFTPEQYRSLERLTNTLCSLFPNIRRDYPRGPDGAVIPYKLDDEALRNFHGILGHYHIQANKSDPGPALQWERLVSPGYVAGERSDLGW